MDEGKFCVYIIVSKDPNLRFLNGNDHAVIVNGLVQMSISPEVSESEKEILAEHIRNMAKATV